MPERPGMKSEAPEYLSADIAAETIDVSNRERAVFRALMLELYRSTPDEFVTWIGDRIAREGIGVSISQIRGFSQFTAQYDEVLTSESTASTSYTDLATVGPTLTGLPDGQYVVLYGAGMSVNNSNAFTALSVNGAAADDTNRILFGASIAAGASTARGSVQTLNAGGNNTLELKYKVSGGTQSFYDRWLLALKYANP